MATSKLFFVANSKMLFVLLGNNNTGKTTLQKMLLKKICKENRDDRMDSSGFDIVHPEIKRKYKKIFFGNRSIQEPKDYKNADTYFTKYEKEWKACDIVFISSHIDAKSKKDVTDIIQNAKKRFYNVTGVFFSNSIEQDKSDNEQIALYDWDERLILENPKIDNKEQIEKQLEEIAENIVVFIANRTSIS